MSENKPVNHFGEENAARYEERFARMAPMRDALHFLTGVALHGLPDDARVLCVGAGTGAELLALATRFPRWSFMAVDPSGPMLRICRQRAAVAGIGARCQFHEGFLTSLPMEPTYHAATSLLVSQFLTVTSQRVAFFREIATRLLPGGRLVTADLSSGGAAPDEHARRIAMWHQMLQQCGVEPPRIAQMLDAWKRDVAILPTADIETMLRQAGFAAPTLISQHLLIHAWLAHRSDQDERTSNAAPELQ